jgi:hypothetical protein
MGTTRVRLLILMYPIGDLSGSGWDTGGPGIRSRGLSASGRPFVSTSPTQGGGSLTAEGALHFLSAWPAFFTARFTLTFVCLVFLASFRTS